ncbi:MAG: MBL fold metallo-hydrolase [Sporomusaceae bacterium]|nr:MBL fold metallo-hydrolase [Sporomusaceae bacterium]
MKVGDYTVFVLSDGINRRTLAQQAELLQGDKAEMQAALAKAYPLGEIESTVNAFLICRGEKLVLIDTGNGTFGAPTMGKVVDNLRLIGYQPEQIHEIYLTHMHGDHVGGLVTATGEPVFANATVYANECEAAYWLDMNHFDSAPEATNRTFHTVKAALAPYQQADRFKTFAGNCQLSMGIQARDLFGHTPGHTAFCIESQGKTLVLWGDIIHVAAIQFHDPAVTIAYDNNKQAAASIRQQILAEAAQQRWLVGGAHFASPGFGYVQAQKSENKKYRFIAIEDDEDI